MNMEEALFRRLFEEIDFDDHPYPGSHNPNPQGNLKVDYHKGAVTLSDERLSIRLGVGNKNEDSIHRWTKEPVRVNKGPERMGEHRWSITPKDLGLQLSAYLAVKVGPPTEMKGDSILTERTLLGQIRNRLAPLLDGWTWHLEVDNKADRMGWYVRAPESWESLFTIFVGLGWHPESPDDKGAFLLFERAPPGELDRPDEEEPNKLDSLRTVALCNSSRGALTKLAGDMEWAFEAKPFPLPELPGDCELWPPSMGRWPLLVGRLPGETDVEKVAEWAGELVERLKPAISTLSAKIEGLNWH